MLAPPRNSFLEAWQKAERTEMQRRKKEEGHATASQIFTVLRVFNVNILIQSAVSQTSSQRFGLGVFFCLLLYFPNQ